MRTLSSNEITNVAGASYSEDIVNAAASIYVGTTIGRVASVASYAAFDIAVCALGTSNTLLPLAWTVGAFGSIVSPLMYFIAPLIAFDAIYPGVLEEKFR